jgi:hypothetical protein
MPELLPYNELSQQQRRILGHRAVSSTCCHESDDREGRHCSLSLRTTVDPETLKVSDVLWHSRIKTIRPHRERRRNLYSSSWSTGLWIVLLWWFNAQSSGGVLGFAPTYRWCSLLKNNSLSVLFRKRQVKSDLSASTTIPPPLSGGGTHLHF